MAKLKTAATEASVEEFLGRVPDPQRREDAFTILKMMEEITGKRPRMWGASMVGFGEYHYVYASGHEGDIFLNGFSPRKDALTLYLCAGLEERSADQVKKLGKVKTGKGCLYIKKLSDIDLAVLRQMIEVNLANLAAIAKARSEEIAAQKRRKRKQ